MVQLPPPLGCPAVPHFCSIQLIPTNLTTQINSHCALLQPNKDDAGNAIHYGENDPSELWGAEGWCTAEKPKFNCPCILVSSAVVLWAVL